MSQNSAANPSRESSQSSWNEYRNGHGHPEGASVENKGSALAPAQQERHQFRQFPYLRQHQHPDYREYEYIEESQTDEDSDEEEEGEVSEAEPEPPKVIRVGEDFQAKIPPLLSKKERKKKIKHPDPENSDLFWSPPPSSHPELTDEMLNKYVTMVVKNHHWSIEQALGLLYWHQYNVNLAIEDLSKFTQLPVEWTSDDKDRFFHAFQYYGKAFNKIQSVLPNKSMGDIIKYYYGWKKRPLQRKPSAGLTAMGADRPVPLNSLSRSHKSNGNHGYQKNSSRIMSKDLYSNQIHEQFRNLSVTKVKGKANLVPLLLPHCHPLHKQHTQRQPPHLLQPRQQNFKSNSNHHNNPFQPATSSASVSTLTSCHGHLVSGSANAVPFHHEDNSSDGVIVID